MPTGFHYHAYPCLNFESMISRGEGQNCVIVFKCRDSVYSLMGKLNYCKVLSANYRSHKSKCLLIHWIMILAIWWK